MIDKEGRVRHASMNDLGIGRSVEECLRLVHAIQFNDKHGEGNMNILLIHPLCHSVSSRMEGGRKDPSSLAQRRHSIWRPFVHPSMPARSRMHLRWMTCVVLHPTRSIQANDQLIGIHTLNT